MRDSFPYTEYMDLIKDIESAKESYEYLNTKEKSGLYTVKKLNEILRNSFEKSKLYIYFIFKIS